MALPVDQGGEVQRSRGRDHLAWMVVWTLACVLLLLAYRSISPYPENVRIVIGQGDSQPATLPLWFEGRDNQVQVVSFQLSLLSARPTHYRVWADECIESVTIGGASVEAIGSGYCDWGKSLSLDLSPYLRTGTNSLSIRFTNRGGPGGLSFAVDPLDPWVLVVRAALLVSVLCLLWKMLAVLQVRVSTSLVIVGALCVRIVYFWLTPARVRSYDLDGHLEYVHFIAEHFVVPRSAAGWEFHQPPLYYALGAVVSSVSRLISPVYQCELDALQLVSLILSIGTFFFGFATVRTLARGCFAELTPLLLLGFLPGLVFSAARISNDTLYHFLAFGWCYAFVRWWGTQRWLDLGIAALALGLALLTKMSALPLLCVMLVGILGRAYVVGEAWTARWVPLTKIVRQYALVLVTVLLSTGWYVFVRLSAGDTLAGSEKLAVLNGALRMPLLPESFLTFNPLALLNAPFVHPFEDSSRRNFFFEYLYRSAFFGEFRFPEVGVWLAASLVGAGYVLLLALLAGIGKLIKERNPRMMFLGLLGAALVGSVMVLRIQFPFSPHQDFRFIHLAALPVGALAAYAVSGSLWLSRAFVAVMVVIAVLSSAFLLRLALIPGPV